MKSSETDIDELRATACALLLLLSEEERRAILEAVTEN